MKISLNWASHWTKVPAYDATSIEQFAHTYSTYTAEVEGVETHVFDDKIVVGKVLGWKPHPDSEKLTLVDIDAGKAGEHTIVCGALNVRESCFVAVALENAKLPDGMVIGKRNIRGVDSCGMICSASELGLPDKYDHGILPLEDIIDLKKLEKLVGTPFGKLSLTMPGFGKDLEYTIDDVVMELDNKFITNRPDLFSVVGNAREIACISKSDFENPEIPVYKPVNTLGVKIDSNAVINYLLCEYSVPEVPETPFIIQLLLSRTGQGMHGFLADLTNLIMTGIGQPMHVFDADTIRGDIVLRMAKNGEQFIGLDTKTYTLSTEDLVIADDEQVLALAGIMGGLASGATAKTRRIFVESATFDPVKVRKTSQRLKVRTDSVIRFEKGVDPALPHLAQSRYETLLKYFIPGAESGESSIYTTKKTSTEISLTQVQIEKKIGKAVDASEVEDILTRLGFTVKEQDSAYKIGVPSWRDTGDVVIPEDIIEEIARHVGYETIDPMALPGPLATARVYSHDTLTQSITSFFADKGYADVYTYPFSLPERFSKFSDAKPQVIENTTENRTHLRAHLAESLLELIANSYRNHPDGAFFEFGPVFDGEEKLAGLGVMWGRDLVRFQEHLTSYMMTYFGTPGIIIQGAGSPRLFAPKAYAEYFDEKEAVALRFGLVRPTLLPMFGITDIDIFAFEILKMPELHRPVKFTPIPAFPGTRRELNFILPESTPVGVVMGLVQDVHAWITDIGVTQVYRDENHIGKDKKSVVVTFLIRNPDATITDAEALEIQTHVIQKLAEAGYPLRGT